MFETNFEPVSYKTTNSVIVNAPPKSGASVSLGFEVRVLALAFRSKVRVSQH